MDMGAVGSLDRLGGGGGVPVHRSGIRAHTRGRAVGILLFMLLPVLAACNRPAAHEPPLRAVRVLELGASQAQAGTMVYAGEVRARVESRLSFRVPGKLLKRLVNVGESVRAGQVLAELDGQDLALAQASAQAGMQAARAQWEQQQADFKRYQMLHEQGFIGLAELQRREAALQAAQAQWAQAQAQWDLQRNQKTYALLRADAPGVITAVEAEVGAVVAAGTPVLRLAHDGPREVLLAMPEDRLEDIRALQRLEAALEGDGLKVRLWGQTIERPARIREVAQAADPLTRTLAVRLQILAPAKPDQQPATKMPEPVLGQTASVLWPRQSQSGFQLPLTALGQQGGRSVVWLWDSVTQTVSPQPVEVGGAQGNEVWVQSGLKPGQKVVTAGIHVLSPGQKVTLYTPPVSSTSLSGPAQAVQPR
jgi:multidrug efflux system membrane fusion protein